MTELKQDNNKETETNKKEYTIIQKFNNEGETFQKVMEKIILRRMNNI